MRVLGIETSCDETSAAVVRDGRFVESCVIASSKSDFGAMGGVIPEEAARKQLESMLPVIKLALEKAKAKEADIDCIAVTYGPGLLGSLLVGTSAARVLSSVWNIPLIPVHHTLGHLSSTWLTDEKEADEPTFPVITLSVSGGHSDVWYRESHTKGRLLGSTRDDAAGEAFDKGAVLLGLGYPGGPALSALADGGDEAAYPFPRPLHADGSLDFSFSGLKTSLKYLLRDLGDASKDEMIRRNIAASYQYAICRHLSDRIGDALHRMENINEVHVVGGVAANKRLRSLLTETLPKNVALRWPSKIVYCTDNAAMIASAGFFLCSEKKTFGTFATSATLEHTKVVGD